jgi:molybdopterin synthase sulfur carrier subunit
MKIRVLYFAHLRETVGFASETIQTQATDVAGLRRQLMAQSESHAQALAEGKAIRCALNQQLCAWDAVLADDAEVAFFPPVTGG